MSAVNNTDLTDRDLTPDTQRPANEVKVKSDEGNPVKSDPVKDDPVKDDPVKDDPDKSDPVKSDPVKSDPDKSDAAEGDAVKGEHPGVVEDDEFSSFLSEVFSLPRTSGAPPRPSGLLTMTPATEVERQAKLMSAFEVNNVTVEWGTGHEQVARILKHRYTASHFELFMLPPYATEDLIRKHYRRLSVLIHPDKCDHPESSDAFFILTKAYEELLKPEFRAQYADVIDEAKQEVLRERKRENKARKQKGQELLPTDDLAIRAETIAKCDAIVKEREERLAYAERTRRDNELRAQRMEAEAEAEEFRKQLNRKKWSEGREQRVDAWRDFRENVVSKKYRGSDDYRRSWR